MFVTRFHASRHSVQRRHLRFALLALDWLSAALISWVVLRPTDGLADQRLGLWLVSAVLSWWLSRKNVPGVLTHSYAQMVLAPLYACLIFGVLLLVTNTPFSAGQLLPLAVLWAVALLLIRLFLRRFLPPLTVGVIPGTDVGGLDHPRVEFLELTTPEDTSFTTVEALVIDLSRPAPTPWVDFYLHAHAGGLPVWDVSTLSEELNGQVTLEYLQNAHMNREHFVAPYASLKRLLDIVAVLLFSAPLLVVMGVVALVVFFDSGRPVLFWQTRVGQDGRPFQIAKFRTMRRDSERGGAAFAQAGDMRITRVGHVLRKFRLDELPQFWNVLRGDMSIIGPRPEQLAFVEQFNSRLHLYSVRHWVKPGITGWAQVTHGYASGEDETLMKLRHDIYYIKHFSPGLDAQIVFKTLWTMATGFGAR